MHKIHVLSDFGPYLRILKAYNRDNFRNHDWRHIFRSVFDALCASLIIICIPVVAILYTWYLIENGIEVKHLVAALPMSLSVIQMLVTFLALLHKNHRISETLQQLRILVDQRRFFSRNLLF